MTYNQNICPICLERFVDEEKLKVLPCKHIFHEKCIDEWLDTGHFVCPDCKVPLVDPEIQLM